MILKTRRRSPISGPTRNQTKLSSQRSISTLGILFTVPDGKRMCLVLQLTSATVLWNPPSLVLCQETLALPNKSTYPTPTLTGMEVDLLILLMDARNLPVNLWKKNLPAQQPPHLFLPPKYCTLQPLPQPLRLGLPNQS
uniref:Uncharacterized protein n=1 Tax=Cacopsylla melanoneura TaxID=428564 RepID=A0A8D8LZE6_9HEMI